MNRIVKWFLWEGKWESFFYFVSFLLFIQFFCNSFFSLFFFLLSVYTCLYYFKSSLFSSFSFLCQFLLQVVGVAVNSKQNGISEWSPLKAVCIQIKQIYMGKVWVLLDMGEIIGQTGPVSLDRTIHQLGQLWIQNQLEEGGMGFIRLSCLGTAITATRNRGCSNEPKQVTKYTQTFFKKNSLFFFFLSFSVYIFFFYYFSYCFSFPLFPLKHFIYSLASPPTISLSTSPFSYFFSFSFWLHFNI